MTGRTTVLHVLEAFSGGTERHLLDLVHHVDGFEHVVAVSHSYLGESTEPAMERARKLGATVEPVDMCRSLSPYRHARALIELRGLIRAVDPDVIHAHSAIGGGFARLPALGSGRPLVYTPNGIAREWWALATERLFRHRADRFIAVSESEAEFALGQRLIDAARLVVIPNGIEIEPLPPPVPTLRERLGIRQGAPLVGSLTRLATQKAPEVFVAACSAVAVEFADAHFLLIGSGPQECEVMEAIARSNLGERFHRLPSLANAAAAFGELDVYVLASRFEGGPYSVLEAMRVGVPVVATAADGTRDAVEDGVTGFLVPIDRPTELAAAIARMLRDPEAREAFGSAGRERLAARFDVRSMAAATAAVYRDLVGPEAASPTHAASTDRLAPERVGR